MEGITPTTEEVVQKIIKGALEAGFSFEEFEAIHAQVWRKSEAADDPEFRNLQRFEEHRFRLLARLMINQGKSVEDFLALVNRAFDTRLVPVIFLHRLVKGDPLARTRDHNAHFHSDNGPSPAAKGS